MKYAFYAVVIVVGLICIVYRWICQSQSFHSETETQQISELFFVYAEQSINHKHPKSQNV